MSRFLGRAVLLALSPLLVLCTIIGTVWIFSIVMLFASILIPFVFWLEHGMLLSWILPFFVCHLIGLICVGVSSEFVELVPESFRRWIYILGTLFWIVLLIVLYHTGNPFIVHALQ